MCELLGVSLKEPARPEISFDALMERGQAFTSGRGNPHGWGVALYPDDKAVQVFKEPIPGRTSPLAQFLKQYDLFLSRTFIAHVRRATRGEKTFSNTHPFVRELNGLNFAFAHNGTIHDSDLLPTGHFCTTGSTDSEALFCHLLHFISEREIRTWGEDEWIDLQEHLGRINEGSNIRNKLNMLLTDGNFLMAYRDRFVSDSFGLHRLERPSGYRPSALPVLCDDEITLQLPDTFLDKGPSQLAAIVATRPLTDEPGWVPFEKGELCIFRRGGLVFTTAGSPRVCDVEVYGASKWLTGQQGNPHVIGMPKALRDVLCVDVGDRITVEHSGSSLKLTVHPTDRRLLLEGSSPAGHPSQHVCLPRQIRQILGLKLFHTRPKPSFKEVFSSVCLENAEDEVRK